MANVSHLSTFWNARDGRPLILASTLVYGLPVGLGLATALAKVHLTHLGDVIGGLSLLAGFLFALVIFVFQLRLQLPRGDDRQVPSDLGQLIDELFANVTYSVVIAVIATAVTIVATTSAPIDGATITKQAAADAAASLDAPSVILVALITHLLAMLLVCLRRTSAAYRELKKVT
jgi:hypothetical protein